MTDAKEIVKQLFHNLDANGDGVLHLAEFRAILKSLGQDATEASVDRLFDAADTDNNGTLSVEEFMDFLFQKDDPIKDKLLENADTLKAEFVVGARVVATDSMYMGQAEQFQIAAGSEGVILKFNDTGSMTIRFESKPEGSRNVLPADFTKLQVVAGLHFEVDSNVLATQSMYTGTYRIEAGWRGRVKAFNATGSATIDWRSGPSHEVLHGTKNVLPQDFQKLKTLERTFGVGEHVQATASMYVKQEIHAIEKDWTGVVEQFNESGSITVEWSGHGRKNVLPADFHKLKTIPAPFEVDDFVKALATKYENQPKCTVEAGWQGRVVRLNESGSLTINWANINESRNVLASDFSILEILEKVIQPKTKVQALIAMYSGQEKCEISAGWRGTVTKHNESGSITVAWEDHGCKNVLAQDVVKLRILSDSDEAATIADVSQQEEEEEIYDDPDVLDLEFIDNESELQKIQELLDVSDPHNLGIGRDVRSDQKKYSKLKIVHAWRTIKRDKQFVYDAKKRIVTREMRLLRKSLEGPFVLSTKLDNATKDQSLDGYVNEKLLLHGTKAELVFPILMNGMNERFSGGLFGKGVYLAEDPSKIDQYCTPDDGQNPDSDVKALHRRLYRGGQAGMQPTPDAPVFYAFGVRVVMGLPVYTKDGETNMNDPDMSIWGTADHRELDVIPNVSSPVHWHSLVAETGGKVMRHRELLVFDGDRTILSYLMAYRRE